jgi:hypothetical protein
MLDKMQIWLRDNKSSPPQPMEASLDPRMNAQSVITAERQWADARASILERALQAGTLRQLDFEHGHWSWTRKISQLLRFNPLVDPVSLSTAADDVRFFGIEAETHWQGLGLYEKCADGDHAAPLIGEFIYVRFLESAPWNLRVPEVEQEPRFSGVGTQMIIGAVRLSLYNGLGGRVVLHALPQAEAFYARLGFVTLGHDPHHENLMAMELSSDAALGLLAKVFGKD